MYELGRTNGVLNFDATPTKLLGLPEDLEPLIAQSTAGITRLLPSDEHQREKGKECLDLCVRI